MNKEEIKHFKAILRQGLLRHRDILLDDKFQKELLNIIKDYEKLQQENKELHNKIDKAIDLYKNCKTEDYCTLDLDMYNALIGGDVDDNR